MIVLSGALAQRGIMGHYVRIHHLAEIGEDEAREGRARLGIPPADKRERESLGERSERDREREKHTPVLVYLISIRKNKRTVYT